MLEDQANRYVLEFEENQRRGEDPVAFLDGQAIFPLDESEKHVEPGETWICDLVVDKGTYAFVWPIEPVTDDWMVAYLTHKPDALEELLESPKGAQLRRRVERWAKAHLHNGLGDRLSTLETRLEHLENDAEEAEPGDAQVQSPNGLDRSKPARESPEDIDDEFIAVKILHQLHTGSYWGRRHTSIKEFQKGSLRGVDTSRIEEVVATLVNGKYLKRFEKSPDPRYSLNPSKRKAIEKALPGNQSNTENAPETDANKPPSRNEEQDRAPTQEGISREQLDRALDPIQKRIESLGRSIQGTTTQLELEREIEELKDTIGSIENRLRSNQSAITSLSGRVDSLKKAWNQDSFPCGNSPKDGPVEGAVG